MCVWGGGGEREGEGCLYLTPRMLTWKDHTFFCGTSITYQSTVNYYNTLLSRQTGVGKLITILVNY